MKKVYLFNEGGRAAAYGIGTYIRQLTECLRGIPYIELNIILLNSGEKEFSIVKKEGYTIYAFPNCDPHIKGERYFQNIWFLFMSNIQTYSDDCLIFHLNYSLEYPLVGLMKHFYPTCKIIFTVHYQNWCFSLCGNIGLFRSIVGNEKNILLDNEKIKLLDDFEKEKKIYQCVDKIICLSDFTKKILQDIYKISKETLLLSYNGLRDECIELSSIEKSVLKQQLFFSEKDKIILFVGRLDEIKGLHILIDAFKQIVNVYPDCHLVIVGAGDFSLYLEKCNSFWNKITFTGFLGKKELYKFYQIADVGVMLSMHEQCSYVAIEMMMFGLPIISTDTTGLDEMILDDELKLRVHYQNGTASISVDDCSAKIILALTNYGLTQLNNRKFYLEKYTLEQMKEKMIAIYSSF